MAVGNAQPTVGNTDCPLAVGRWPDPAKTTTQRSEADGARQGFRTPLFGCWPCWTKPLDYAARQLWSSGVFFFRTRRGGTYTGVVGVIRVCCTPYVF